MTMHDPTDELLTGMLRARAGADVPAWLLARTMQEVAATRQLRPGFAGGISMPRGRTERIALLAAATLLLGALAVGGAMAAGLIDLQLPPDPTSPAVIVMPTASPGPSDATQPGLAPTMKPGASPRASSAPPVQPVPPAWSLPAGWRYDLACDWETGDTPGPTTYCALHLYDDSGREQDGWPVTINGDCYDGVVVGPEHSAFVACTRNNRAVVTGLDPTGKPLPGWPVIVPGSVANSSWNDFAWGGVESAAVGPDGTVYMGVTPPSDDSGYQIHAFAPDGSPRKGWPRELPGGAQGFALAPDGTVVAWWYEGVQEDSIDLQARRTVYTMIGPDGRTLPGWPKGSTGAASGPVVWTDGSIYYTSATGKVYGHDRTGAIIDGWPYRLPYPVAPELRSDGALVFVGDSDVIVLDRRGRMVRGWPFETRSTFLEPGCDTGGFSSRASVLTPDGTLYLAPWDGARSSVVALDPSGATVAGWPYRVPAGWRVVWLSPGSGGVLEAALTGDPCGGARDDTSIRLSAAGDLVGDPPGTPLAVVYEALRLRGLKTASGETTFAQGAPIDFEFGLVNRSSSPVVLPRVSFVENTDSTDTYYASGTLQTWLERLGPDTDMDCLPRADRKGTWYAAGGWVNSSTVPVTVPPGGDVGTTLQRSLSPELTACLPPGAYRYHVEYKPIDGDEDEVFDHRTIDVTITGTEPSAPAPTPTVTPRPSPTLRPTAAPTPLATAGPDVSPTPSLPSPAATN